MPLHIWEYSRGSRCSWEDQTAQGGKQEKNLLRKQRGVKMSRSIREWQRGTERMERGL